ncbi:hypothetical protein UFOVP84_147 [uncultured Caudovirales phage]|uniref:Uncharacterized protein n=1 Tax=uncultured Caudovirales phage TaxID=2100421 RepID=A0A6J5KXS9_9CAUD|nr:hypothetical protein UFOVP84_147 [uncultured Caudovirales phage]
MRSSSKYLCMLHKKPMIIVTNGVVRLLNAAAKNEIPDTSSSINGGTTQNATTLK